LFPYTPLVRSGGPARLSLPRRAGPSRGRAGRLPFREARLRVRALCRRLDLYPKSLLPRHAAALARARRAVTRPALEAALAGGPLPDLTAVPADVLEAELRELGRQHGAGAAPLLQRRALGTPAKGVRHADRRARYRLPAPGASAAAAGRRPPTGPLIRRQPERATAAWLSGIDGSGSRAAWIVFAGGLGGGLRLCSLILNHEAGN